MKVCIKLLGELRQYLPECGKFNQCKLNIPTGSTLQKILSQLKVPDDQDFIVLLNGDLMQKQEYASIIPGSGDEIIIFSPIKGG
ncbi:MAG: MoaD/ThiS family protein [Gammaproteobacteria bacterium]|nr:MoaD/ThiS family protein [Gammaproteobacteria bacterium]